MTTDAERFTLPLATAAYENLYPATEPDDPLQRQPLKGTPS
ncbi:hypothetical protein [Nocardia iowensis]|nr:hypothetical protein [Nocardia iowensis]